MDYKILLGFLAVAIAFISYVPYFINIFADKTKPHAFTWLVWGTISMIIFFGQLLNNGGPGAWVTGFSGVMCIVIFIFGLIKGRDNIVPFDWICLAGTGSAIFLWLLTKEPVFSVILVTLIDLLAFFPTVRKSLHKPHEETAFTYFLSGLKFVLSLIALQHLSLITGLYPFAVAMMDWGFVLFLLLHRKKTHQRIQFNLIPIAKLLRSKRTLKSSEH